MQVPSTNHEPKHCPLSFSELPRPFRNFTDGVSFRIAKYFLNVVILPVPTISLLKFGGLTVPIKNKTLAFVGGKGLRVLSPFGNILRYSYITPQSKPIFLNCARKKEEKFLCVGFRELGIDPIVNVYYRIK